MSSSCRSRAINKKLMWDLLAWNVVKIVDPDLEYFWQHQILRSILESYIFSLTRSIRILLWLWGKRYTNCNMWQLPQQLTTSFCPALSPSQPKFVIVFLPSEQRKPSHQQIHRRVSKPLSSLYGSDASEILKYHSEYRTQTSTADRFREQRVLYNKTDALKCLQREIW